VIALDRDGDMLELARRQFKRFKVDAKRFKLIRSNYSEVESIVARLGSVNKIDAVVIDCGLCSAQLDDPERGFSFLRDGPLLAVYEQDAKYNAQQWINEAPERELAKVFRELGEERHAKKIARAIVAARKRKPITRTVQLADIVKNAIPVALRPKKIHPATKTFLAIRLHLNRELPALEKGAQGALNVISKGGKVLIISYHSLEDRIVKRTFSNAARACTCPPEQPVCTCGGKPQFKVLTPKPITPTKEEIDKNPRARSAKLRAIEKIL
jgi:16S rRNA (cytosine1402-N4)-methyltransferase